MVARKPTRSDWQGAGVPSLTDIETLAAEALALMPETFRQLCKNVIIQVEDFPTREVLASLRLENEFSLLGLFEGVGLPFQSTTVPQLLPNRIWLYRHPILHYWIQYDDTLGAIVTHVLVHEIGHHFGLSDEDIEAIEQEAD
jgi:predicted Zn-dependent protease with MMP-like domain